MKILWMTWKDGKHPQAGGAETVNEELAKRLARDGHEVVFLVSGFAHGAAEEKCDGFRVVRMGGRYSVYWHAYRYYKKHLQGWADIVIDEMNTIPFFARWYVKERSVLFAHQLCREIWFYQMPFPLSLIGYAAEPVYLRLLRGYNVITVSESSKRDLMRYGFKAEKISIISEGIDIQPLASLTEVEKYAEPTLLSLGALRSMKRTLHQIRAFEKAKQSIPDLKLKVAGAPAGNYGQRVLRMIENSPYASDIQYCGRVSLEQKLELMRRCHAILVTSVKEGWGLIVTEANSQGTPAVAYDVDGLRDSVRNGETGLLAKRNTPEALAEAVAELFRDPARYESLRHAAWQWSQQITFERSYKEFLSGLDNR